MLVSFLSGQPSYAIDSRLTHSDFLPIKEVTSPPDGASSLCSIYGWACSKSGQVIQFDKMRLKTLHEINREVNRSVRSVTDIEQYGVPERWVLPTDGRGDCEDYALYKKYKLTQIGFPPEKMLIATLLDLNRDSHAVLVVRTGAADLILDNLTDRIVSWSKTGYSFLRIQDPREPRRWVAVMEGGIFVTE